MRYRRISVADIAYRVSDQPTGVVRVRGVPSRVNQADCVTATLLAPDNYRTSVQIESALTCTDEMGASCDVGRLLRSVAERDYQIEVTGKTQDTGSSIVFQVESITTRLNSPTPRYYTIP